jgi:hypothetical protein
MSPSDRFFQTGVTAGRAKEAESMVQIIRFLGHELFKKPFRPKAASDTSDITSRWNIAPSIRASWHDEGLVLFHASNGHVFSCSRPGARIWENLSNGLTLATIAEDLANEYGLMPDQSTRDVLQFAASLWQHGLITRKVDEL